MRGKELGQDKTQIKEARSVRPCSRGSLKILQLENVEKLSVDTSERSAVRES